MSETENNENLLLEDENDKSNSNEILDEKEKIKKKIIIYLVASFVIVALVIAIVMISTQSKSSYKFADEQTMRTSVQGTWVDDNFEMAMVINDDKVYVYDVKITMNLYSTDEEKSISDVTPESLGREEEITYDYKKSYIYLGTYDEPYYFLSKDNIGHDCNKEQLYDFHKINTDIQVPPEYVEEKVEYYQQKDEFEKKIEKLPSWQEFKYNPYGNLGVTPYIECTATLDDYYNWGYDNLSALFFCIRATPLNGSYSDSVYIYASRQDYGELFNVLQEGSRTVTLIFNPWYYEGFEHDQGMLEDYFIK